MSPFGLHSSGLCDWTLVYYVVFLFPVDYATCIIYCYLNTGYFLPFYISFQVELVFRSKGKIILQRCFCLCSLSQHFAFEPWWPSSLLYVIIFEGSCLYLPDVNKTSKIRVRIVYGYSIKIVTCHKKCKVWKETTRAKAFNVCICMLVIILRPDISLFRRDETRVITLKRKSCMTFSKLVQEAKHLNSISV